MDRLTINGREFILNRWPHESKQPLRAWDAADELLLDHALGILDGENVGEKDQLMIINDAFGALASVLHQWRPVLWSDSWLSHQAVLLNYQHNQLIETPRLLSSMHEPNGAFHTVLIKVPKTTALLEDQLRKIRPCLTPNTKIIAAGMVKHLQSSAFKAFERFVGPVSTSLARKKARLIFAKYDANLQDLPPVTTAAFQDRDAENINLMGYANVFSKQKLDQGARFLLSVFPRLPKAERVIDLGCGNGVLGIVYRLQNPKAQVVFIDESYMAVASSRQNYRSAVSESPDESQFIVGNGLDKVSEQSTDLILCNPPFHQQHTLAKSIAINFFSSSTRCLTFGGTLCVVANRHLNYQPILHRLFGHCERFAENDKFQVLCARRID